MTLDLSAEDTATAEGPVSRYTEMDPQQLQNRIQAAKDKLGEQLVILGHHYQKDEVIQFADFRGDSLKLSQQAAENRAARFIVFCGVHFMAETADMLTDERVSVLLPDLAAGCSMADMADIDQVETCWGELQDVIDTDQITPITYVNSTAALKAFCGKNHGTVCTSSNADRVLAAAFKERSRVLFFPDQHLGRNTAKSLGIGLEQMIVWDPSLPLGGNTPDAVADAKVILWKGWCSVHQIFQPSDVEMFRQRDPEIRIIVHPECDMAVVDLADSAGSTEHIIKAVRTAPPGSKWAIGTELHLVNRLKNEHPEQEIHFLSSMVSMCATMYRIDLAHLCWVLERLVEGEVVNRVQVPAEICRWSRKALDRMLSLG